MTTRSILRRRRAGRARRIGDHRFRDHAVVPGDELAVGIEAGLDVMRRHRPELAAGDIVLAAPDQLDRLAHRLGEAHRVEHHLLLAAAAIAAAEEMLVQGDVGAVGLQQARDLVVQAASGPGCRSRSRPTCRRG